MRSTSAITAFLLVAVLWIAPTAAAQDFESLVGVGRFDEADDLRASVRYDTLERIEVQIATIRDLVELG